MSVDFGSTCERIKSPGLVQFLDLDFGAVGGDESLKVTDANRFRFIKACKRYHLYEKRLGPLWAMVGGIRHVLKHTSENLWDQLMVMSIQQVYILFYECKIIILIHLNILLLNLFLFLYTIYIYCCFFFFIHVDIFFSSLFLNDDITILSYFLDGHGIFWTFND